jgi:hypothetical protein
MHSISHFDVIGTESSVLSWISFQRLNAQPNKLDTLRNNVCLGVR